MTEVVTEDDRFPDIYKEGRMNRIYEIVEEEKVNTEETDVNSTSLNAVRIMRNQIYMRRGNQSRRGYPCTTHTRRSSRI